MHALPCRDIQQHQRGVCVHGVLTRDVHELYWRNGVLSMPVWNGFAHGGEQRSSLHGMPTWHLLAIAWHRRLPRLPRR